MDRTQAFDNLLYISLFLKPHAQGLSETLLFGGRYSEFGRLDSLCTITGFGYLMLYLFHEINTGYLLDNEVCDISTVSIVLQEYIC